MTDERIALYYTRCPVPTASGLAFQRGLFEPAFADSSYEVRNLTELGEAHRNAHYTHSNEFFFREGGGSPPMWARGRGVESVLLGITFMQELLGIYVRTDDPAQSVGDLAGRKIALPVWPHLVFNFWRFAAEKGITSALAAHDMGRGDVNFVDIEEGWDPHERRQVGRVDREKSARCEYRGQLQALLASDVDAIFGKGPEAALLESEGAGRVRLLYDVRNSPNLEHRVNNSTPRLFTTSRRLLEEHPEAVTRYLRTVLQAARWAQDHPAQTRRLIARECAVAEAVLENYLQADYLTELFPGFSRQSVNAAQIMQRFLFDNGYLDHEVDIDRWAESAILASAYEDEGLRMPP